MIVNAKSSMVLDAEDAWEEYADERGESMSLGDLFFASQEEKDNYKKKKDHWELLWIMKNCGYDAAEYFAKLRDDKEHYLWNTFCSLMPCMYNECNLKCLRFEKCVKEGFVVNGTN